MNTELARFNMIEQQIRPWEVLDQAVLSLLATVRREDFVPPALRALAFVDTQVPLPVSDGKTAFMLEPKVEARLLQELQVQRHDSGAANIVRRRPDKNIFQGHNHYAPEAPKRSSQAVTCSGAILPNSTSPVAGGTNACPGFSVSSASAIDPGQRKVFGSRFNA